MFKKLINWMYIGKGDKRDFSEEDLPKTRLGLFFAILKENWRQLLPLNVLFVFSILPVLLWTGWMIMAVLWTGDPETLGAAFAPDAAAVLRDYFLVLIPVGAISGPGFAAFSFVLRRWAQDEHAFVWGDFWAAYKANFGKALLLGLINGAAVFILYYAYWYYGVQAMTNLNQRILQYCILVIALLWVLLQQFLMPMLVTYETGLWNIIKTSASMMMARIHWSLLILIVSLIVPALLLLVLRWSLVLIAVYTLCGFAVTGLGWVCNAVAAFDKYLNPKLGVEVNRGLHPDYKG